MLKLLYWINAFSSGSLYYRGSIYIKNSSFHLVIASLLWTSNKSKLGSKSEKVHLHLVCSSQTQQISCNRSPDEGHLREVNRGRKYVSLSLLMLKAVSPLHSCMRIIVLRILIFFMDFSAPLLDLGDHQPSPRPPVSPVCPPSVCHEKLSPALWHCAPVPWL